MWICVVFLPLQVFLIDSFLLLEVSRLEFSIYLCLFMYCKSSSSSFFSSSSCGSSDDLFIQKFLSFLSAVFPSIRWSSKRTVGSPSNTLRTILCSSILLIWSYHRLILCHSHLMTSYTSHSSLMFAFLSPSLRVLLFILLRLVAACLGPGCTYPIFDTLCHNRCYACFVYPDFAVCTHVFVVLYDIS